MRRKKTDDLAFSVIVFLMVLAFLTVITFGSAWGLLALFVLSVASVIVRNK